MAQELFKGFKQVVSGFSNFEIGYVYFVRTNSGKTDGYIQFNGKKYGTAEDVDTELRTLIGEVPTGYTSVMDYIADIREASIEGLDALDADLSGASHGVEVEVVQTDGLLTGVRVTAPDFDELYDELGAADSALTAAENYTDAAIEALDATVSGSNHGVEVEVTQADGVITNVTVTAPDFDGEYDEIGAADSALTDAKAYTDSAITALDATVEGSDSGVTVEVIEADGVVTGVNVETHISEVAGNALEMKSDGLFAAIYYEDNDTE